MIAQDERLRQSQVIAGMVDYYAKRKHYGELRIRFEAGQVVCAKSEETLKLEDMAKLIR